LNLLGYWKVLKSQKRVVFIGILVSLVLAALALFRISPDGVSLRTPPVYEATSTLLVTAGTSRDGSPTVAPEYQAQIYAELAAGDAVRRIVDPTLKRELVYSVDPVSGGNGTPLPLITVTAFSPEPRKALTLANRVREALKSYVVSTQAAQPEARRTKLTTIAHANKATVYSGARTTPGLMLFVLGLTGTVFIAFTRHNLSLARRLEDEGDKTGHMTDVAHASEHDGDEPVREAAQVQQLERVAAARERKGPRGTLSG
jgi:capsular polysaccharide biosynthesis protein